MRERGCMWCLEEGAKFVVWGSEKVVKVLVARMRLRRGFGSVVEVVD